MIDEKMMKIAKIRNSYAMKKFGTLSYEEKALLDYDSFCIELIKENQKYKEVFDKAINSIDILQEIIYQQPTNNSADDLWLLDKLDGIKNILKEVE